MSIPPNDDTDSTDSDCDYNSELDVDMCVEDDVDAPYSIDIDGDVDIEREGEDGEPTEEEDETEEEVVDDDEEEDEDNGTEPRTISQGEMVNTFADNVDTMVYDEPTAQPEQGQEMRKHTPQPQPPAPAPRSQTLAPPPRPRTPVTPTFCGLELLGLGTPRKPRPAAPTLRDDEAAGNTSDVDLEQQLLGELAGGYGLPDGPLPDVLLPDSPLPNVRLPDVPLPDVPLAEACPDDSVGEE